MALSSQVSTKLASWNFHTFHVQKDLEGGKFVSAESTLIAAGPPSITSVINQKKGEGIILDDKVDRQVLPIGVLENSGVQQSKQLQRIFEIGSARAYFIPGRVVGSVSFGRVFYHGPTLLRMLYAYYNDGSGKYGIDPSTELGLNFPSNSNLPTLSVAPGYDSFWFNMFSDTFNQPTGILMYFRDMANRDVGALYLEYLYLQGHQLSISSGSVLLMEGTSGQFDRIVPARMQLKRTT